MKTLSSSFVLATDRGGHLQNALKLIEQIGHFPSALISTYGPDIDSLKTNSSLKNVEIYSVPHLFSWIGKTRFLNPFKVLAHALAALCLAVRLRPVNVVSVGGSNTIFFCYCARLWGARIYHVECMNQVVHPSITGRMLYPICSELYVQWEELLKCYGKKARYAGWVL